MPNDHFDYIIVGAGTAGCLLANRLSADPANRVLLLEAGKNDNYYWIKISVGYLYCIGNPRTDWLFKTAPEPGLNGRSLLYPRGKTLGGCSSINGMIYMRGQARDYNNWARLTGEQAWAWENAIDDFKAHEDHHRLDGGADPATGDNARFSDLHGHGGEWRVDKQRLSWDILDAFADAAVESGVPRTDDFNSGDNEGVGFFEVNQKSGWRWSSSMAFLRPATSRPNLTVWTEAQAERLVFTWRPQSVDATHALNLSAGVSNSNVLRGRSLTCRMCARRRSTTCARSRWRRVAARTRSMTGRQRFWAATGSPRCWRSSATTRRSRWR